MKLTTIIFLSILLAAACNKENVNEEFTIAYGETIKIDGSKLKITFNDVQDSRCPKDVQCITEGFAKAGFIMEKKGSRSTVELKSKGLCFDESGPCGGETVVDGYLVQLLYVYPYPEKSGKIEKEEYNAKIRIVSNDID